MIELDLKDLAMFGVDIYKKPGEDVEIEVWHEGAQPVDTEVPGIVASVCIAMVDAFLPANRHLDALVVVVKFLERAILDMRSSPDPLKLAKKRLH